MQSYTVTQNAVSPIATMYQRKMAEECTPAMTSRIIIDYRNIPALRVKGLGRKFETSSTKDTRDIHDRSGQHLRG